METFDFIKVFTAWKAHATRNLWSLKRELQVDHCKVSFPGAREV